MKYVRDQQFKESVRSLMALPFLREWDITRSFLEVKASTTDDDALLVYEYFERTWINGFGTALICKYGELFRTDNKRRSFPQHTEADLHSTPSVWRVRRKDERPHGLCQDRVGSRATAPQTS